MSDEVICLSSDENEKSSNKRKSDDDSDPKVKNPRVVKSGSPQPGYSKDFDRIERKAVKPQLIVKRKITIPDASEDVFQNFIKTCLEKRDDQDTKKVLLKLEKLYNKLSPLDKSSEELRLFITSCHDKITKGFSNDIYTPILDLHTEIKNCIQMNLVDQQAATGSNAEDNVEEIKVSKQDMKKIKLLEKSIQECLIKIKQLEESEVDFDQDNDSAYIQEDKYKKRLVQLCNMLSKISGDKMLRKQILKKKIRRRDIPDEMTEISSVDDAITSFVNSDIGKINQLKYLENQRCADHIKMPEYLDILKCIEKCNQDSNLCLSKEKMNKLAKKAFQAVGNFLKKKRMEESNDYIQSFLTADNQDPANKDVALRQKLQKNKKEGDRKLEEIFKKYVDKQEGLLKQGQQVAEEFRDDSEIDDTDDQDLDNSVSSCSATQEESNDEELKSSLDEKPIFASESRINDENRVVDGECVVNIVDDEVLVINDALDDNVAAAKDPLAINDKIMMKGSSTEQVVQASFIQVCAFAKPPPAWGELSPEPVKPKSKLASQQALLQDRHHLPKPEYIDLTKEREKPTSSLPSLRKPTCHTRSINPLANRKFSLPTTTKRVVIVKNVINNYNVPFNKRDGGGQAPWLSKDK